MLPGTSQTIQLFDRPLRQKGNQYGYAKRFRQGKYCLGNNRLLGYDTVDGKLVPNQEAWIIRRIFELFVQEKTYAEIEQTILREGGNGLRKKGAITLSTLQYIVRNEAYVGDKRLQKKAPVNYLTKRPDATIPYETYYLQDDHEAIITREIWNCAQALLAQHEADRKKGVIRRGEHHVFYGKLFCAECGAPYTRRTLRESEQRGGGQYKAWNCKERQKGKKGNGCKNRILRECELQKMIAAQLGWNEFDEDRFQWEVQRVAVERTGLHIEQKEESV